jgi:glutathione S-transferase
MKAPVFTDSIGKYSLIAVPWDTKCEMIKWALDLHQANYIDRDVPFGFHIWETADTKNDSVPVLVNHKNEVFNTPTAILMYLYSQAFSGRVRLYSSLEALEEQEYLDKTLYPASRTLFLDAVLKSPELTKEYIFECHSLRKWRNLMQLFWPLVYWLYKLYFSISEKSVKEAWNTWDVCFDRIEKKLKPDAKFLIGDSITSADLSFASHVGMVFSLKQDEIEKYKVRRGGKYAINLLNSKPTSLGQKLDCNAEENNPDWGKTLAHLRITIVNIAMLTIIPTGLPFMIDMDWQGTVMLWAAAMFVGYNHFSSSIPETITKVKSIASLIASKKS